MPQPDQIKICLIGQSLAFGGAEKAMANLSFYFESRGIVVWNVIVLDEIAYPFAGKLLNLGKLKGKTNSVADKFVRFTALRNFLDREKFDRIIDFRIRVSFVQEYFIRKLLYKSPVFYTVHSAMLPLYFPTKKWQARMVYASANGIVAVSDGLKQQITQAFGLKNVAVIPNAVEIEKIENQSAQQIPFADKFIVAAGRMDDDVKQFDRLITAYEASDLPAKKIKLVVLGDGKNRVGYEATASANVHFAGFVQNPYAWFSKAQFFVLSSKNEGLPMVIAESFAAGTPVLAFDCDAGPREMVFDGKNGLLVDNQNFKQLIAKMNELANDPEKLSLLKANSKAAAANYALEKVGRRWLGYLKINVS